MTYQELEAERDAYRAAFRVLAEYARIGTERPPDAVFEFFRKLHEFEWPAPRDVTR